MKSKASKPTAKGKPASITSKHASTLGKLGGRPKGSPSKIGSKKA